MYFPRWFVVKHSTNHGFISITCVNGSLMSEKIRLIKLIEFSLHSIGISGCAWKKGVAFGRLYDTQQILEGWRLRKVNFILWIHLFYTKLGNVAFLYLKAFIYKLG